MLFLKLLQGNKLVLPLACIATIAMLAIGELSFWYTAQFTRESLAVVQTQNSLSDLHEQMLDAETGQRGFLLTGNKEYLLPYEEAIKPGNQNYAALRPRYAARPEATALLAELEQTAKAKLQEMAQTINLKKGGLQQAGLDTVMNDSGRQKMQRMRLITASLQTIEARALTDLQARAQRVMWASRVSIALLSMLCLVAIVFYLQKTLRLRAEQLELRRLLSVERDRLEIVVRERTQELTELTRYLQTNREDERSRLAHNLHDDLGALLTSAKLDTARIKSRVDQSSPELVELLAHLVTNLNSSIALGRKIIEDLRPSSLSHLGLVATLDIFAREFAESSDLAVHSSFEEVDLPADSQLMVYRLMQEACTNIMKYAKASNVWLRLEKVDGLISASVRDDGVGFDTKKRLNASYGLLGMRYRVEAAQGVLHIESTAGQGTLVQATL